MDTGLDAHLLKVLERHGERWQISQEAETGVWVAIVRPTPTQRHFIVAHTLAELDAKLIADAGGEFA